IPGEGHARRSNRESYSRLHIAEPLGNVMTLYVDVHELKHSHHRAIIRREARAWDLCRDVIEKDWRETVFRAAAGGAPPIQAFGPTPAVDEVCADGEVNPLSVADVFGKRPHVRGDVSG